ncbi:MAG: sulfatase [Bacteroidales bacterium]|nr:sulfatase [Bacteroidales bacterium]
MAFLPFVLGAQDRPNILWLTFEDTSPFELGCYGNPAADTPLIDSLARVGIRFTNAYAGGPQSSPSRSTLYTGAWCSTYAMDWHRSRVKTPEGIFFPQYLRDAGYYCTNNQKTDYNTTLRAGHCWDECSGTATYNSPKRAEGQPFFAVFNSNITHMSRLTSVHTDGRRDFSKEGLGPDRLPLPPHVPDLPEVQSDYAFHVEGVNDADKWVRLFLDDLKARGLDDNTIVFVFSDHGGCLPRGKAFAYETSFRVPAVVYFPEKWKHLAGMPLGKASDRMVSFVDFGPTVLSLAGVPIPSYMQGNAFFGEQAGARRRYQYGVMTNRTIHFAPARSISDGRYKYIRYYIPYKKDNLYNYFQWQMPANIYWDKAYFEGKLDPVHRRPYEYAPAESFYDLKKDPYELNDLAGKWWLRLRKNALRRRLSRHLRESTDIGLLPVTTRGGQSPYERVRAEGYDLELLYRLAELTLNVSEKDIPFLEQIVSSSCENEFKFWVAVNLGVLARRGVEATVPALRALLSVQDNMVTQEAAAALCYTSALDEGFAFLLGTPRETMALEMLSLDPAMRDKFPQAVIDMLRVSSDKFETIKFDAMPMMNSGINQRKVLVNLGLIPADEMYGPNVYKIGVGVNKTRRKLKPTPNPVAGPDDEDNNQE